MEAIEKTNVAQYIAQSGKEACCGCAACEAVCPRHCVVMRPDSEGFLYPSVDESACIDCGKCVRTCSFRRPFEPYAPKQSYAFIHNDDLVRQQSSSGGVFTRLAMSVLHRGGVVFGASFDAEWQVRISYTESAEGLQAFRGSKYVQASVGTAYADVKAFLRQERLVLFSGSPCQVAGLHHFLGRNYDNLITVDFACHGVPSPKVWAMYVREKQREARSPVTRVCFRDKRGGWHGFHLTFCFKNNTVASQPQNADLYMQAFLDNLTERPSCAACKAKSGCSHSDITFADFWGLEHLMPELDDDKGASLVIVRTERGGTLLDVQGKEFHRVDYAAALQYIPTLETSSASSPKRELFFKKLRRRRNVGRLIDRTLHPLTVRQRINICVYHWILRLKKLFSK